MIPRLFMVDDEAPARARLKMLLADIALQCPHELVGEASDARAALEGIATLHPDIVLLDVQMPGMNGLEFAAALARNGVGASAAAAGALAPAIIFISAFEQHALRAFEVQAFDYLLKPVRAERMAMAIRRVTALRAGAAGEEPAPHSAPRRAHFSIHERDRTLLVPVADIIYLKAELKYVTLRTGTREYLIEESLSSIEEEFSDLFVRVHRNALAARAAITGVERGGGNVDAEGEGDKTQEPWQLVLRGVDERLPISRRQWPVVKALVR